VKEKSHDQNDIKVLEKITKSTYEYFALATKYLNKSILPHKRDVIELRAMSDSLLSGNTTTNDVLNFQKYVFNLLDKYKHIDESEKPDIINLTGSEKFKIKFLEYYALNNIIIEFHSFHYAFIDYLIVVVPEDERVKLGENFNAEIHLSVNNRYNPLKAVIGNDTISSGDGKFPDVIEVSLPADEKGEIAHEAKLLINHMGKTDIIPFSIKYYVE